MNKKVCPPMTLQEYIDILDISQDELARLFKVTARTIRRWHSDWRDVPGTAICALVAWKRLRDMNTQWRPDAIDASGYLLGGVDNEYVAGQTRFIINTWYNGGKNKPDES